MAAMRHTASVLNQYFSPPAVMDYHSAAPQLFLAGTYENMPVTWQITTSIAGVVGDPDHTKGFIPM